MKTNINQTIRAILSFILLLLLINPIFATNLTEEQRQKNNDYIDNLLNRTNNINPLPVITNKSNLKLSQRDVTILALVFWIAIILIILMGIIIYLRIRESSTDL